jgi:hypothetical protein
MNQLLTNNGKRASQIARIQITIVLPTIKLKPRLAIIRPLNDPVLQIAIIDATAVTGPYGIVTWPDSHVLEVITHKGAMWSNKSILESYRTHLFSDTFSTSRKQPIFAITVWLRLSRGANLH